MSDQADKTSDCCMRRTRHAAGTDPAKRDQILDGAYRVFFDKGFDATSMNDVCKTAGVSKGTIYVYFADKTDLFEALVGRERDRLFTGLDALLESDRPLRDKLIAYGTALATALCSERVISAQRIVIGTIEKLPDMVRRFYDAGAQKSHNRLRQLLEQEIAAGRLQLEDTELASYQIIELSTAGLWRQRIFNKRPTLPSPEEIDRVVRSGVDMFLAASAPSGA